MPSKNPGTSIRFSPETRDKIDDLVRWHGLSVATVVEMGVAIFHQYGPLPTPTLEAIVEAAKEVEVRLADPPERKRGRPRKQPAISNATSAKPKRARKPQEEPQQ